MGAGLDVAPLRDEPYVFTPTDGPEAFALARDGPRQRAPADLVRPLARRRPRPTALTQAVPAACRPHDLSSGTSASGMARPREHEPTGEVEADHVGPQHAAVDEGHEGADVVGVDGEVGEPAASARPGRRLRARAGADVWTEPDAVSPVEAPAAAAWPAGRWGTAAGRARTRPRGRRRPVGVDLAQGADQGARDELDVGGEGAVAEAVGDTASEARTRSSRLRRERRGRERRRRGGDGSTRGCRGSGGCCAAERGGRVHPAARQVEGRPGRG